MASDNTYISESPMMKDNLVVVISAADTIRTEEIDVTNPYGFMSPLGGGFMEIVRPVGLRGSDLVMVVDDNGLSKNLRENRAASALYRNTIVGDVVICPEIDTIEGPDLACFSREMAEAFISKIMEQAPYLTKENNQEKTMEAKAMGNIEEKSTDQREKEIAQQTAEKDNKAKENEQGDKTYRFAGIGSRETPQFILDYMKKTAAPLLEKAGYILQSGGAKGADSAFASGFSNTKNMRVVNPNSFYIRGRVMYKQTPEGLESVDKYHPNPSALKDFVRSLMERNYYQVMGNPSADMKRVDFVLCWAPLDDKGLPTGGTAQAIRIANANNIPVYNIAVPGTMEKFEKEILGKQITNATEFEKHNTSKRQNTGNTRSKYSFRDTGKYFTIVAPTPDSVTPEQKEIFSAIIKAFSDLGYTPRINSSKNNEGIIPKGVNYVLVGKKTQMTKEALSSLDKYSPESDEIHRQSCAEKHMAIMGDGKSARSDFVLICSSEGKLGPAMHTAIIAEDPAVNIPVFDIGRKDKAGVLVDYQALRDAFSNVKRGASVIDAVRRQNTGLHSGPEKVYSRYVKQEVASEKQNDRAFENMSRSALWNHVFRESSLHPVHGSSPVHEREKNPYSLDTTDPTVSVNEWTFQMPEDDNSAALDSEIVVPSRVTITELPRNQYVFVIPDTDDDLIELNADMNYAEDGVSRNTDVVALADVTEYETLTTRGQLEAYMETLNVDRDGISNDTVARFFSPIDRRNENGDRFYSHEELIAMEIMNDGDTWSNIKNEYFGNDFGNENSAREYSESENIIEM